MVKNEKGRLIIPEAEQGLPSEYVKRLLEALKAGLQARIFIVETMSQQAYAYLTNKGIGIDDLSDALVSYETDSKISANKAFQSFEHFLYKLCEDAGGTVNNLNGIAQYANEAKRVNALLNNQLHLCHGMAALRNMAHHDPDKETGRPWNFTPQGAIISALLVPTVIRSLYLYWTEKKQEF